MRTIPFMCRPAPAVPTRKSGAKCSSPSRSGPTRSLRMADRILVLYGSYRSNRMGIRLADFIVAGLRARGEAAAVVRAKMLGRPMLGRESIGEVGQGLQIAFPRFADDLAWWTEAAKSQRARKAPPY